MQTCVEGQALFAFLCHALQPIIQGEVLTACNNLIVATAWFNSRRGNGLEA